MKSSLLNSTNISLMLAFLSLVVASAPTYWTYQCRSSGVFCEGSITAPQSTARNLEGVTERMTTDAGRKAFQGLFVSEGGFWPFTHRRDLVARFSGEPDVAIDTFPYSDGEAAIYNNDREHIVAIVRMSSGTHAASVVAYFPSANLAKRTFDLQCAYEYQRKDVVRVANFGYSHEQRRIIVDVSSPCETLALSTGQSFDIGRGLFRSHGSDRGPYGASVAIMLSASFHVAAAHAVHLEERRKEAIGNVEQCKHQYFALPDRRNGDLWPCLSSQADDLTMRWRQLEVYQFEEARGLVHSDSDNCELAYWHLSKDRKAIFVACGETSRDLSKSDLRLSEYRSTHMGAREITHFIKGDCRHLAGYEFETADDGKSLDFRLDTNCSELEIDGRTFSVPLMPGTVKTVAMYRLFRDQHEIVVGLSPLAPPTTSAIPEPQRTP